MNALPTFRRCVYAAAALTLLYGTLFVGVERPLAFRILMVLGGFFLVFPIDSMLRLVHLMADIRPKPIDYIFSSALAPGEGHIEPDDYTLVGVITEVRKLTNEENS